MQCATCAPDATASIPTRAPHVELRAVHGILFSHGRCETLKSAAAPLHTGVCRVATPPPSSKQQCAGPVSVSTLRRSHACSCMILVGSALAAGTEYRDRNGQHSTVPSRSKCRSVSEVRTATAQYNMRRGITRRTWRTVEGPRTSSRQRSTSTRLSRQPRWTLNVRSHV